MRLLQQGLVTAIAIGSCAGGVGVLQAQVLGPEFQVNTYTTYGQLYPAVAVANSGEFVVVWENRDPTGADDNVYGQLYEADGTPLGSEFLVNSYTSTYAAFPAVASLGSSGFVVVWTSNQQDGSDTGVFGQRFAWSGAPVGSEFQVNSHTTSYQRYPAVAADAGGSFVVVWSSLDQDGSGNGVFGQRFDPSGVPSGPEFRANVFTTGHQSSPAVAVDASGRFLVAWQASDLSGSGVLGRAFLATGDPASGDLVLNAFTTGDQRSPSLAADGSGGFVAVWSSLAQDGDDSGIFGRMLDLSGQPLAGDFPVNSFTLGTQSSPAVAASGSGGFVVSWESYLQDGSGAGVFGQRFAASGSRVGEEFQVNAFTTGWQNAQRVAAADGGNFVVAWVSDGQDGSYGGIFARRGTVRLFVDGFEMGDVCSWSSTVGGGPCP